MNKKYLEIQKLIQENRSDLRIEEVLSNYHENDIAELLENLSRAERKRIYHVLGIAKTANVFPVQETEGAGLLYGNHCNNIRNHRSDRICCIGSACGDPKKHGCVRRVCSGAFYCSGRRRHSGFDPGGNTAGYVHQSDLCDRRSCDMSFCSDSGDPHDGGTFRIRIASGRRCRSRDLHGIWNYACSGNSRRECIPGCFCRCRDRRRRRASSGCDGKCSPSVYFHKIRTLYQEISY